MTKDQQDSPPGQAGLDVAFSEPKAVFAFVPRPLEQIKDSAIVVLDTNVLLLPYGTGKQSLEQIRTTLAALASEKRLVVPGQVAREFAKHRPEKLKTVYQQLSVSRGFTVPLKPAYPLLTALPLFGAVATAHARLDEAASTYRRAVDELLAQVESWLWNDPVSEVYSHVFQSDVVVELVHDSKATEEEWQNRRTNRIPPGYLDGDRIGDFLIWKTVLQVGRERKQDVIFVSGDEKSDWRYQSASKALWPRYELIEEFRRETQGLTFHILGFAELLELSNAPKKVIEEVRREEATQSISAVQTVEGPSDLEVEVENAIASAYISEPRARRLAMKDLRGPGIQVGPFLRWLREMAESEPAEYLRDLIAIGVVKDVKTAIQIMAHLRRTRLPFTTTLGAIRDGRFSEITRVQGGGDEGGPPMYAAS